MCQLLTIAVKSLFDSLLSYILLGAATIGQSVAQPLSDMRALCKCSLISHTFCDSIYRLETSFLKFWICWSTYADSGQSSYWRPSYFPLLNTPNSGQLSSRHQLPVLFLHRLSKLGSVTTSDQPVQLQIITVIKKKVLLDNGVLSYTLRRYNTCFSFRSRTVSSIFQKLWLVQCQTS